MASRKLTALPTATEVTTSDKIYIVDVSDTTESPQGTSKQALISELPSSGITSLTSTDGSIDIDLTDPSAPDLSIPFGIWTPVISQESANITASITGLDGSNTFFQVGNIVFYTMILSITISSGTTGSFETTIPVSSVFNNGSQGSAGFSGTLFNEDLGFLQRLEVSTNGTEGGLLFTLNWQNDSSGGFSLYLIGQYNVQS